MYVHRTGFKRYLKVHAPLGYVLFLLVITLIFVSAHSPMDSLLYMMHYTAIVILNTILILRRSF